MSAHNFVLMFFQSLRFVKAAKPSAYIKKKNRSSLYKGSVLGTSKETEYGLAD